MTEKAMLFFMVRKGPGQKFMLAWRKKLIQSVNAASAFAKSKGVGDGFYPGLHNELVGLPIPDGGSVLPGWKKNKRLPYRQYPHSKEAKAEVGALLHPPTRRDIEEFFKIPDCVRYKSKDVDGWSAITLPGSVTTVRVEWHGNIFILGTPDINAVLDKIKKDYPGARTNPSIWRPSEYLHPITEGERDLIAAKCRVAQEKRSNKK